jgi:hypothetical protein
MRIQSIVDIWMQDLMNLRRGPTRMCRNRIETREGFSMAGKPRGTALTVFALLYVLLAISDFAKPFSHSPGVGFVFMGVRLHGTGNAIMGPLFGFLLLVYAYGIWTMRRYALPVAYIFTGWVIVNTVLYALKHRNEPQPSVAVAIASTAIGIGVPLATAIILSRRSADLS